MSSVVIVGGNECMARRYKELCLEYSCNAKVYTKMSSALSDIGCPDLLVLFTSTISHKMLRRVLGDSKRRNMRVARSHTSSINALKSILEEHTSECSAV